MIPFSNWIQKIISELGENFSEKSFRILDSTSPNGEVRSLTIALDSAKLPAILSIYWANSQEKLYEKKFEDTTAAMEAFKLYAEDLGHAEELTSEEKDQEAIAFMDSFAKKVLRESDDPVSVNEPPITTTMASKKEADKNRDTSFRLEVFDTAKQLEKGQKAQISLEAVDVEVVQKVIKQLKDQGFSTYTSSGNLAIQAQKELTKEAKVTMQNIFFSTPAEAVEYQEKMKALQPVTETKDILPGTENPLGEELGEEVGEEGLGDEIAPGSVSYADAEKQEEKKEKDFLKTIKKEVSDQIESALEQKIATQFTPSDRALVEAMRGVGRTWEEIRDFMVKTLKYDEDTVVAYLDKLRGEVDLKDTQKEVTPPEVVTPPTPPTDLVSPETHDKLVEEVESKMAEAAVQQKVALDPLEVPPTPDPVKELKAPIDELPETPPEVSIPATTEFQPGDRVYVMSEPPHSREGEVGEFVEVKEENGKKFALIKKDGTPAPIMVPYHLVTKAALNKEAVEPVVETEMPVKFYKKTPPHVDPTKATPPTADIERTYTEIQKAQANLDTLKAMVEKAEAKFLAEKAKIEEKGGRLENETKLKEQLNRLSRLVDATDSRLVSLGDELAHVKQEMKTKPGFIWSDRVKLDLLLKKFPEAESYIASAVERSKELDTTELAKELIIFPKRKLSKLHKVTNLTDILDDLSRELLKALQIIIPLR